MLGESPERVRFGLPDAIAVGALLLVTLCIGWLGGASPAAAQGQGAPHRPEGSGGSNPAARGGTAPAASPGSGEPAVTLPGTPSTLPRDPPPSTSDHGGRSDPPPGRLPADGLVQDSSPNGGTQHRDWALGGPRDPATGPPAGPPLSGPKVVPGGGPEGGSNGGAAGSSHGPVPLNSRSDALKPRVPEASGPPSDRRPTTSVTGPRKPVADPAAPPTPYPRGSELSPSYESSSRHTPPAAAEGARPPGTALTSFEGSGQSPSDAPAAHGTGSPPQPSTRVEFPTPTVRSTPIAPTVQARGETHHRGSTPAGMPDTGMRASAVRRTQMARKIAPALGASRSPAVAVSAVGTRAGHAAAAASRVAPAEPMVPAGRTGGWASAGSSTSSAAGPLGLMLALLFTLLLHWSTVALVPQRCRRSVFLAFPERPG
jgi:hypothetical protein